jgi:hypothetical protein
MLVEVVDRQLWVKEAESDWVVKYTKRSWRGRRGTEEEEQMSSSIEVR